MKLQTIQRAVKGKNDAKKLRREGFIPAVLYKKDKDGETLAVNATEFQAHLRHVKQGHLPTTVFKLVDEKGGERPVLVKEIQYEITTYAVKHLDFEELVPGQKINVKVPIEFTGLVDCVGVKLGGVLRQVIRHALVRCESQDIPSFFSLDVRELGMRQSKRLKDLSIPNTVRPLANLEEVIAVIVKR